MRFLKETEIIFIEYGKSLLPRCKSPMNSSIEPEICKISIPGRLMEMIEDDNDPHRTLYLDAPQIEETYGHLPPRSFPKMCKLHFLKLLKETGKKLIVFASGDVIEAIEPEFSGTRKDESSLCIPPRPIICTVFPLNPPRADEVYYVSFSNQGCVFAELYSFRYETAPLLCKTALMEA